MGGWEHEPSTRARSHSGAHTLAEPPLPLQPLPTPPPPNLPQNKNTFPQEADDLKRARQVELPPLQSVLELTSASRPPTRMGEVVEVEAVAPTINARELKDGSGVLKDGTTWV